MGGGEGGTMRVWRRKETHKYIENFKNLKGKSKLQDEISDTFKYTVDRNDSEIIWNRLFWILAISNV